MIIKTIIIIIIITLMLIDGNADDYYYSYCDKDALFQKRNMSK